MNDYYNILGLSPNADEKEIKARFRFLSHAYHPDKFPEEQKQCAEEEFKRINAAYQILSREDKRADYDASLRTASATAPPFEAKKSNAPSPSQKTGKAEPQRPPSTKVRPSYRCKAIKRWQLWCHMDCELIVSDRGMHFIDYENSKYSFKIPFNVLEKAYFSPSKKAGMETDLVVSLPGGISHEIGLNGGDREQVLETLKLLNIT
jgi:curved DNA-binding protein CbpA